MIMCCRLLAAAGVILALSLLPGAALAASPNDPTAGCSGSWQKGTYLLVDCSPGFTSQHDRIYVYPRTAPDTGADWRAGLDMSNAVWLVNAGAGPNSSLLIDFHPDKDGKGVVADLFDDQTGAGEVDYQMVNGIPTPGNPHPTVHVVAPDGWWLKDGAINYNLQIDVDGPVQTGWQSEIYAKDLRTDGRIDYSITVSDQQHPGHPDWELVRAFPPLPSADAVTRSALMVSPDGDQPIQGYIFWPFLSPNTWHLVQGYNLRQPPIQVDWQTGRITDIGEFVASRGAPNNWFIYSDAAFGQDAGAYANFENPFGFYDLAGKHDGYPDLEIRDQYAGPSDPWREGGSIPDALNIIRYSWDQQHRHMWDYKVDLMGRNAIDSRIALGPLTIQTVPHADYPDWVLSKQWDVVAFVAAEQGINWTSEGIYASPLPIDRIDHYLTGEDPRPLGQAGWGIDEGFRTDYRAAPGSKPDLYFSPIDHKLHLLQAQGGVWNLGNNRELRYFNLGGQYINRWELRSQGKVQEALSFVDGQLIYESSRGVSIRSVDASPAVFTASPPRDHDSWAELGSQLDANKARFEGTDLAAMFGQFNSPSQAISGARLWDLHVTSDGFGFSIDVPTSPTAGAPWRDLAPGQYSVTYAPGRDYSVSQFTPASLEFTSLQVSSARSLALQAVEASLTVTNGGTEASNGASLRFTASEAGRPATPIGPPQQLDVPGNSSRQLRVSWVPPRPGKWDIQAEVTDASGTRTAASTTVSVADSPTSNLFALLAASDLGFRVLAPIGALLGTLLLTAFAVLVYQRPRGGDG